jgi:hypothetical protein
MAEMADSGSISQTKRAKALAALVAHGDVASAARASGISERSIYRWIREDSDFQAELRVAQRELMETAMRRVTALAGDALTVLAILLLERSTPPAVKLRAALGTLDQLLKLRALIDQEERITRLEQTLSSRET